MSAQHEAPAGRGATAGADGADRASDNDGANGIGAGAGAAVAIEVNGETRTAPAGLPLADLLALLEVPPKGVAVAVNREVVPRRLWPERPIAAGDRIEVVRAIGGG